MRTRNRLGFTLVELLISLVIMGVVITVALGFVAQQNSAYQEALSRMVALRNLRYATTSLSQDLETLGTNVPPGQPALIYADEDAIAFAADYATNVEDDPFAVYYDPDVPSGQVIAPSGEFPIPGSSVSFPDTVYEAGAGVRSPAEIIMFWVEADTSTSRTDDFLLMRGVNSTSREVLARNLLRTGSEPFFQYFSLINGGEELEQVADSMLPIRHTVSNHGSAADTGAVARADSVRAMRVQLSASDGQSGSNEDILDLSRLIGFPNAVVETLSTCGSSPILGTPLAASLAVLSTGEPGSALSWQPAVDEAGGELDVTRYVIWRREFLSTDWGEPFLAIPAGASSYSYEDAAVEKGKSYEYALAAQDCTPLLSPLATAGPVVIPII